MTDLILLPGLLGVSSQLRPLGALLEDSCHLHYLELPGHGGWRRHTIKYNMALIS